MFCEKTIGLFAFSRRRKRQTSIIHKLYCRSASIRADLRQTMALDLGISENELGSWATVRLRLGIIDAPL